MTLKFFVTQFLPYGALFGWFCYSIYMILDKRNNLDFSSSRIISSIPNVFVSIGLLGTFIGIAYGLYNFEINETQITLSIEKLLEGLKTAMFTSIFGIILSIVFGICIRLYINEPDSLELQELRAINDNFHNFLSSFSTTYHEAIVNALKDTLGQFNGVFMKYIEQLVESNFEQLTNSIDQLNTWQIEHKEDVNNLKKLYSNIVSKHKAFVNKTEEWVDNLDKIAGSSSQLKKIINDFNEAFNDNGDLSKMVLQLKETANHLKETSLNLEKQSSNLNTTQTHIETWVTQIDSITNNIAEISTHLEMIKQFRLSDLEGLEKQFDTNLGKTLASFDKLIKEYVELLGKKIKDEKIK